MAGWCEEHLPAGWEPVATVERVAGRDHCRSYRSPANRLLPLSSVRRGEISGPSKPFLDLILVKCI